MEEKSTTYKIAGSFIIHELLDDEVILANLDTGAYFSIREAGTYIWQLLIEGHSQETIERLFEEKLQTSWKQQIGALIDFLLSEAILVPAASANTLQPPSICLPGSIQPPLYEKHDELKNLLMLDPIHEVDEQGWPGLS